MYEVDKIQEEWRAIAFEDERRWCVSRTSTSWWGCKGGYLIVTRGVFVDDLANNQIRHAINKPDSNFSFFLMGEKQKYLDGIH